jgi:hypothetical protein
VRNPIVWEFLVDEDEYRKALPGQRDFSFGLYRRDYWFFDKLYWNKRLLDLCNKIWSFHDELENTAEILSLGSKEVKSRASECYSARA